MKHGYDALSMRNECRKIPKREGDVAEEGQWRRVVELRLQFIIALRQNEVVFCRLPDNLSMAFSSPQETSTQSLMLDALPPSGVACYTL